MGRGQQCAPGCRGGAQSDRYFWGVRSRVQLSIGLEGEGAWPMEKSPSEQDVPLPHPRASYNRRKTDPGGRTLGTLLRDVGQVILPCSAPFCQIGYSPASRERVLWGLSQMTGMKSTLAIVKHFSNARCYFYYPRFPCIECDPITGGRCLSAPEGATKEEMAGPQLQLLGPLDQAWASPPGAHPFPHCP